MLIKSHNLNSEKTKIYVRPSHGSHLCVGSQITLSTKTIRPGTASDPICDANPWQSNPMAAMAQLNLVSFSSSLVVSHVVCSLDDPNKMIRKPYTITKSREIWTEPEHDKFLEALHLSQDDELSPLAQRLCASSVSPGSNIGKNSPWNGSLSLIEYKVNKKDGAADASTQTEDICKTRRICARGVSTDDGLLDPKSSNICLNEGLKIKETSQICRDLTSPPPSTSSISSSGRPDTLEALIKADARKLKNFRILEEEELRMLSGTKLKASNIIMQLISCGSVSVKDPSFGMIPTYKPRFSLENIAIREALRNLICTSCGGPLFPRTHTSTTKNCESKMLI